VRLFDLSPLISAMEQSRRRTRGLLLGLGALFAFGALVAYLGGGSLRVLTPLQILLIPFFALWAGVTLLLAVLIRYLLSAPTLATLDEEGLRLNWGPAKQRTYRWENSRWWFALLDWREQMRSDPNLRVNGPFSMTRVGINAVWLTEEAGEGLIAGAKAAGIKLRSHVSVVPRTTLRPILWADERSLYR
jgi:hypothetical protein